MLNLFITRCVYYVFVKTSEKFVQNIKKYEWSLCTILLWSKMHVVKKCCAYTTNKNLYAAITWSYVLMSNANE